jgi:hypothetical protein
MKCNHPVILVGILLVSITLAFSQEAENRKALRNSINFNPIGIALGTIGGNYEHLFGQKHGIMIQGAFPTGYALGMGSGIAVELQYRYHYFRKNNQIGLNSPFWGPFVYYEKSKTEIKDNNGTKYNVDIKYFKVGANWGKRWIWGNTFNLVFRIGYGIPLYAGYNWSPNEPDQVETIETLTTALAGVDGELTIGFAF